MKNQVLIGLLSAVSLFAHSQNKTFSIGANTPNANAALHVESPTNNQGVIMPRLTTAQRTAMTLSTADIGLQLYDTDLKGIFVWDGVAWKTGGAAFPIIVSQSSASNLLDITNSGSGNGISATATGAGYAGSFINTNPSNAKQAIYAASNSDAPYADAIQAIHTGTGGSAGSFISGNAGSSSAALYVQVGGTGAAGFFTQNGASGNILELASNWSIVARVDKSGTGFFNSGNFTTSGTGSPGYFGINNSSNASAALYATTNGTGNACLFENTNVANLTPALQANSAGGPAIYGYNTGPGPAGSFSINNSSSTNAAVYAGTNGTAPALSATAIGTGNAGKFEITNSASYAHALMVKTNGNSTAIYGQNNGTSNAGYFEITNASNSTAALGGSTVGTGNAISGYTSGSGGSAGWFSIANSASTAPTIRATTNGLSNAGYFETTNSSNGTPAIATYSNGTGYSLYSENSGTGRAASFKISNAASPRAAVFSETNGTGPAGYFFNGSVIGPQISGPVALAAETQGLTGPAARFLNNSSSNSSAAVEVISISSAGPALYALSEFSNNIAVFQFGNASPVNVARIDKTGKGFFNGGTQTGGADVAEMFDVEGARNEYEPGDVLVISESTDRTVEKSFEANSTKVVGVYATRPGVILTEKDIEENLDDLVPMGVIGVVPTKVCLENGPIKRGDLLVTSSRKGRAMKGVSLRGDGVFPSGTILGKALENFDGSGPGIIKVLISVK